MGGLELDATATKRLPVGLEPSAITAQLSPGLDSYLSTIKRWCLGMGGWELAATAAERLLVRLEPSANIIRPGFIPAV